MEVFLVLGILFVSSMAFNIDLATVKPAWQQPWLMETILRLNPHLTKESISGRIFNGWEATPHEFPFIASLFFETNSGTYVCGCSLISPTFVVTAAHCAVGANRFYLIFGAHNRDILEGTQIRVDVDGGNKNIHPNYNTDNLHNDIALVRMNNAISLSDVIRVVTLPSFSQSGESFEQWWGITAGWGGYENGSPSTLRAVSNAILSNSQCSETLSVWPDLICFSGENGRGVCGGDSGGPLIIDNNGHVLVGVTSFIVGDCGGGYPSGFTRITSYLTWIRDNSDAVIGN